MNKILRLVCRQADFKKIVSIGFFAAFLAVFLSAGTAQAGFFDWFNLNKASNDSQQAATIVNAKATSTAATIKVISPNGGEIWKAGTKKNIVFKGNLIKEKVDIVLWWDARINSMSIGEGITSGNGKASTYSWTIPKNLEGRSDYEIFVAYKGREEGDSSDKTFTIKNASGSSSSKSSSSKSSKSSSSRSSKSSATTTSVYMLKINKSGKGYVSDGGGLNCGTTCAEKYWPGSEVKLTASPYGGYVFEKFSPEKECASIYTDSFGLNDNQWIKQALAYRDGENVVCVTTMNKSKTITAIFKKISGSSSSKSKSSSSRSSKSSSSSNSSATTTPSNV